MVPDLVKVILLVIVVLAAPGIAASLLRNYAFGAFQPDLSGPDLTARFKLAQGAFRFNRRYVRLRRDVERLSNARQYEAAYAAAADLRDHVAEMFGTENLIYAVALSELGGMATQLGRNQEAEGLLRQAAALYLADTETNPYRVELLLELSQRLEVNHSGPSAAELLSQALALQLGEVGNQSPDLLPTLLQLGRVRRMIDDLPGAESALRHAVEIQSAGSGLESPEALASQHLLAQVLLESGKLEAARELLSDLLARHAQAEQGLPVPMCETRILFARVLEKMGETEAALRHLLEALDFARGSQEASAGEWLQRTIFAAAGLYVRTGRLADAEALLPELKSRAQHDFADKVEDPALALYLSAKIRESLAHSDLTFDASGSDFVLRRALEIQVELPDSDAAVLSLISFHLERSQFAAVIPLLDRLRGRALPAEQEVAYLTKLNELALRLKTLGQFASAEPIYLELIERARAFPALGRPAYGSFLNNLAGLYMATGRHTQAAASYRESLEIMEETVGRAHPNYAATLSNLAGVYEELGKTEEAESLYRQSVQLARQLAPPDPTRLAIALDNSASFYSRSGRGAAAEPLLREALALLEAEGAASRHHLTIVLTNYAVWFRDCGQDEEARSHCRRALQTLRSAEVGEPVHAGALMRLGEIQLSMGDKEQAATLLREALRLWQGLFGDEYPDTMVCAELLSAACAIGEHPNANPPDRGGDRTQHWLN